MVIGNYANFDDIFSTRAWSVSSTECDWSLFLGFMTVLFLSFKKNHMHGFSTIERFVVEMILCSRLRTNKYDNEEKYLNAMCREITITSFLSRFRNEKQATH